MLLLAFHTSEGQSRSDTLVATVQESWANIAKKLKEIDYTPTTWTSGTHPFYPFKYKLIDRPLSFPAAVANCKIQGGSLLHGDKDITKYIPDLPEKTDTWYSTKDTTPLLAMKQSDIQYFNDNIGTCYTVSKAESPSEMIIAKEANCQQKHKSICTKMIEQYREKYTYRKDVETLTGLATHVEQEDSAIITALQRMLKIGNPTQDTHHPAGLDQTIQLLGTLDESLNDLYTNMPYFPKKSETTEKIHNIRNTAHTLLALVISQHLENYSKKIDILITSMDTQPNQDNSQDDHESGIHDELGNLQTAIDIQSLQDQLTQFRDTAQQYVQTQQEAYKITKDNKDKIETALPQINSNQRQLRSIKDKVKNLNQRLNSWIQQDISRKQPSSSNHTKAASNLHNLANSSKSKLPKVLVDFLQNEDYIWAAVAVTILISTVAIINSVVICIYTRKTTQRNEKIKKHLLLNPKYRKDEDAETTLLLNGSRLDRIESRITKLEKTTKILHQQVKQQEQPRQIQTSHAKKKRNNAPPPPGQTFKK